MADDKDSGSFRRSLLSFAAKSAAAGLDRLEDTLFKGEEADIGGAAEAGGSGPPGAAANASATQGATVVKGPQVLGGLPPEMGQAPPSTGLRDAMISKAQANGALPGEPLTEAQAIYWDPFALVEQLGYKEKPTAVTYGTLQAMVWRLPILRAIIKTRVDQIAAFCLPQQPPQDPGFRVRLRETSRTPQVYELQEMRRIEEWLLTTGVVLEDRRERHGMEYLVRQITNDTLMYDQLNLEVVGDRKGRPCQWYAVDPATVRFVDSAKLAPEHSMDAPYCVQIYDNVVTGEFTRREMVFGVRNPRSDIRSHGYGTSETEMMVNTITYLLWGMEYNGRQFSQGSIAKGLLNIKGPMPERQLRAFRRQWYQMVAGVENAWRTPIINAEDMEWVDLNKSNRDMEFGAWLDFLIKIACAIYAMDPIEVNFKYGGSGQKAMFEAANKVKIVESKAKGLQPLLKFVGKVFNENVLWPNTEDFSLEFTGLSPMTPKELADLETQKVRTYVMVDEIRAMHDMAPLADGLGQIIDSPNWMEARRELLLQEQMAAEQGGGEKKPESSSSSATDSNTATPGTAPGGTQQPPPAVTKSLADDSTVWDIRL